MPTNGSWPRGMQVPYFIYFDVPPADIDVNIHPTKTEIKFENEQHVWQILSAAVKDAIGRFCDIPSINFDTEGRPDIPVFDPAHDSAQAPQPTYNPSYNPFTLPPPPRCPLPCRRFPAGAPPRHALRSSPAPPPLRLAARPPAPVAGFHPPKVRRRPPALLFDAPVPATHPPGEVAGALSVQGPLHHDRRQVGPDDYRPAPCLRPHPVRALPRPEERP